MYEILRYAANIRRIELEARLYSFLGGTVCEGPFVGMRCLAEAHASVLGPKLLGIYEKEIQSELLRLVGVADSFLDIGCAEGYYTTGIARLEQPVSVVGVDVNQKSLAAAGLMAQLNGVSDRCTFVDSIVAGMPRLSGHVLVMIDVDGAEIPVIDDFFAASAAHAECCSSYEFIVETDYRPDGGSNRDDIVAAFEGYGCMLQGEILQDLALRISSIPSAFTRSFLDLAICGMEGRPVDQSWLIFSKRGI